MDYISAGMPSDPEDDAEIHSLAETWNALRSDDGIDQTTWGLLEPLERAVTDCFQMRPVDLVRARSLTARAFRIITGEADGT